MGTFIIAIALLQQPSLAAPSYCPASTTDATEETTGRRRHPAWRVLKGIGKSVNHLRPFQHHRRGRMATNEGG